MKFFILFIITFISLILPACSNISSPSTENNPSNNENQRLNSELKDSDSNFSKNTQYNVKFPISGNVNSGDLNENLSFKPNENSISSDEISSETKSNPLDIKYPNKEFLGTYSSKVYTKTEDRQKNLRIVCEKLTGTILTPNQEFSYNTTCGPYNKENGFGKATVFLGDGTETQDYGGGVCQLSSTLYNAIKDLNVEITERHTHSKKVYYVPDGQDATVSYGNLDFKFKNLNNYSLLFEASSSAEAVNVNVYKI